MVNKYRGEVEVTFGGRKRVLKFDYNAFCDVETAMGDKPISEILPDKPVPLSMKTLRSLLWGGLHRQDPTLTEDRIRRNPKRNDRTA